MKKVLIVEDNHDTLKTLEQLVKEVDSDTTVLLADCVDDAYLFTMQNTIDVFIVDLILKPEKSGGDMSGAGFVQKVRGIKKYSFTPVIFVTSLYDTKNYMYSQMHCYQFVEKPFDSEKLKKTIEKALEYRTMSEQDRHWYYKMDGMVGAVLLGDIIYARSKRQEMNVITVKERISISYKTCQDMLKEIDSADFAMCKKGVIVNRKFIKQIDSANRYIYLWDCDDVLEIGSIMKKKFLAWFYRK